jgi:hypothetical protein
MKPVIHYDYRWRYAVMPLAFGNGSRRGGLRGGRTN